MTQETRKDPRAKVLTMTVRYKSATLDEFIEHHSYDVSRGGMFIKTPSPFPPGTLLKFEVKISGEQRVMQGVGRVVWKRESSEVAEARPAGMGVKFIKIDDESRKVIDQLVAARGDGASAFEQGAEGGGARQPPAREIPSQVVAPSLAAREPLGAATKPRKATMLGLGAMHAEPESAETAAAEAFFPPPQADQQMPAPEDRTVMKQAAELLQDALREAGGSLEEVGSTKEAPAREVPKAEPAPTPAAKVEKAAAAPVTAKERVEKADKADNVSTPKPPVERAVAEKSVIVNARPRDEVTQPAVRRPSVAPAARRSEPPKARSAAVQEAAGAAAESSGSGRFVLALIAVAAVGAAIYFLKKPADVPPEPEAPAAQAPETAPAPEPSPQMTAAPAPPEPTATAAATASASPSASAEAAATAAPTTSAAPTAAATAAPAKPPAAKKPATKPAPAKPPATTPVEPTPPTEPTRPTEPVAPTAAPAPVVPAPETPAPEAPKPAPKPKAPTPAPTDKSGDNPY